MEGYELTLNIKPDNANYLKNRAVTPKIKGNEGAPTANKAIPKP